MENYDYDVAVVGAGPAGSSAARTTQKAGIPTVLVERRSLPRQKPCSGLVIPEAVAAVTEQFGSPPDDVFADPNTFRAMRIHFPSRRTFEIPIDGWSVRRDRFDAWLCHNAGSDVLAPVTLRQFTESSDRVTLHCERPDGQPITITSRVMIAADGGASAVARTIDPRGARALHWFIAVQDTHAGTCDLEPGYFHFFARPDISRYPAAYFKDGLLTMDVGARVGEKVRPHQVRFQDFLRRECGFADDALVRTLGCRITFAAPQGWSCFGTDRVLVAGEASGLLNNFGEGISSALASGMIAGQAAVETLADETTPGLLYRQRVASEWRKTRATFDLRKQLLGSTGKIDWRIGMRNLPLPARAVALVDLGAWFSRDIPALRHLGRAAALVAAAGGHRFSPSCPPRSQVLP